MQRKTKYLTVKYDADKLALAQVKKQLDTSNHARRCGNHFDSICACYVFRTEHKLVEMLSGNMRRTVVEETKRCDARGRRFNCFQ